MGTIILRKNSAPPIPNICPSLRGRRDGHINQERGNAHSRMLSSIGRQLLLLALVHAHHPHETIFALDATVDGRVVFAVCRGSLFKSQDGGQLWHSTGLDSWRELLDLEKVGTVALAVSPRYVLDDESTQEVLLLVGTSVMRSKDGRPYVVAGRPAWQHAVHPSRRGNLRRGGSICDGWRGASGPARCCPPVASLQ